MLLILTVGGFFRFYGLMTGLPYSFHVDEWHIINDSLEMYSHNSLRPPTFDYPSLLYYLHVGLAALIGWFQAPSLYSLHIAGRITSAFFGTVSIGAVYLLGRGAYGKQVGLLAAALFACTVTALREAHFATIDTLNALFIILSVHALIRITAEGGLKHYLLAGIFIGLAAGTKYNGFLLTMPLFLAHVLRDIPASNSLQELIRNCWQKWWIRVWQGHFLWSVMAMVVVFLVTTPFACLDPIHFVLFVGGKLLRCWAGVVAWNHHYFGTLPYVYYITNLLFWGMGPLLEAAGLSGMLYLLVRRRKPNLVIASWTLLYFALVGIWFNKAARYALPMLPFLAVGAAVLLVETKAYLSNCNRRIWASAWVLLIAAVLGSGLLYSMAYLRIYAYPHTGIQALRWSLANIPSGSTVLLEPTEWERPPIDGGAALVPAAFSAVDAGRYRFKYLDVLKFADGHADPDDLRVLLKQTLDNVDYIVMSIRWCEGLESSPIASPVIRSYYRNLGQENGNFIKVAEFTSYPGLWGSEWNDDWSELNFRIFDHPRVMIFKRRNLNR
ncbi:MAG: glycosyltransferase family 39 protein [Pseudomonadota bacterium]